MHLAGFLQFTPFYLGGYFYIKLQAVALVAVCRCLSIYSLKRAKKNKIRICATYHMLLVLLELTLRRN